MVDGDIFEERAVVVNRPERNYLLLESEDGRFASFNGNRLACTSEADDSTVWDRHGRNELIHVETGTVVNKVSSSTSSKFTLSFPSKLELNSEDLVSVEFEETHGPAELPSVYLKHLKEDGWVCLPCILDSKIVEGLELVACTDRYEGRTRVRAHAIAQHVAVAKTAAEPLSLWLIRQYMGIPDIRLSHAPAMAVLYKDDGQRDVQGWHSDFPYHWGTGVRGQVPTPTRETVLGVQRNVCVSDFTKERGATAFKLGSHALDRPPPREWGQAQTYRRGYRAQHGLPYTGPDADVVEAPGGSIILYDSRTWHRAGVNRTDHPRAAMLQAMTPMYVFPKNDTSMAFKAYRESEAFAQSNERERMEIQQLMVHEFTGPGGEFAIGPDQELTESLRT
ncbi:MAG: phytanoyl-CoA dioxygenase family protein [Gammaproteobacteria bacterium]|nr:phytanoyl-CoA dioxygenase family protein [Gammaproteobacteria bacterium]